MTATLSKIAIPSLVLAWSLAPATGHAATSTTPASCPTTSSSLNGWYGLLVSGGTLGSNPTPKYLAGALLFNGAGGISGNHVYQGAGISTAASGSYVVNADCSVTIDLSLGGGAVQTYSVALVSGNGEAVGIETDASAVATIDLQAQYSTPTTGLNFTSSSLNGTFAANCSGPAGGYSDTNLVTFANGTLSGTDPYNNGGAFGAANIPYTGTYTVNSDGTFLGSLTVESTPFDFYGVISNTGTEVQYIYSAVNNGVATAAFSSCTGGAALGSVTNPTPGFTLAPTSATLNLTPNQGGTDVITVKDTNGFTGTVSLAVTGVPSGASSAFVGTTLVIFASSSTAPGTYPLTVTGTSGAISATTTVNLVITSTTLKAQTITFPAIAAQKVGATVGLTATATSNLAVTYASTSPSICTVSGSTAAMIAPGTCSITASQVGNTTYAAATPVSQSFTVSGVTAGSFTLSAKSANVVVTPPTCFFVFCFGGTSATDAITVTASGGFSGTVALTVSGLPSGVTGSFKPTSVASGASSTLTLTPASGAATGKSTSLTITGTSGSGASALSATTTITLAY